MDGATLQQRIYAGRGKAALRIGLPCTQWRPTTAATPYGTNVGTILAAFNAGDETYLKPNLYGKPIWYADLDGRVTQPGDYLVRVSDGAIWFIAAQQQILPIVAIDCSRSIKISRQAASTTVGAGGYSGIQAPTIILGSTALWPASILVGGRPSNAIGLPADVKEAGWRILLPPSVPVTIKAGDIITDDLARGFAIESAEQTDLGWRITANEVHA